MKEGNNFFYPHTDHSQCECNPFFCTAVCMHVTTVWVWSFFLYCCMHVVTTTTSSHSSSVDPVCLSAFKSFAVNKNTARVVIALLTLYVCLLSSLLHSSVTAYSGVGSSSVFSAYIRHFLCYLVCRTTYKISLSGTPPLSSWGWWLKLVCSLHYNIHSFEVPGTTPQDRKNKRMHSSLLYTTAVKSTYTAQLLCYHPLIRQNKKSSVISKCRWYGSCAVALFTAADVAEQK